VRKIPARAAIRGFRRRFDFAKDICINTCFTFAGAARERESQVADPVAGRPPSPADTTIHLMLIRPDPVMHRKAEPYAGSATPNCSRLDIKLLQARGIDPEPRSVR
jgi:hypothetical protein